MHTFSIEELESMASAYMWKDDQWGLDETDQMMVEMIHARLESRRSKTA